MANWIKTIDNDVKEKYKTSPPQTCGEKGMFISSFLLSTKAEQQGQYPGHRREIEAKRNRCR